MNRKLKWPTWQHLKCQILLFPIWFIFTNDLDYITLKNSLRDAKNGKYLFNILKRLNPSLILESVLDCWLGLILFWNVSLAGGFDRKMEFIVTGDFTIVIWLFCLLPAWLWEDLWWPLPSCSISFSPLTPKSLAYSALFLWPAAGSVLYFMLLNKYLVPRRARGVMEVTEWHDSKVMVREMRWMEAEDGMEDTRRMKTVRIEMRDGGDICGYNDQCGRKCASLL